MGDLAEALTLHRVGEGEWGAYADPRYEAGTGMLGGWTAAVALRSVIDAPERLGEPAAITVNFARALPPDRQVLIRAHPIASGRSVQHWRIELLDSEDSRLLAHAMAITVRRQPTDGFTEQAMPEAPDPDSLGATHPPGEFGTRVLIRPVFGIPFLAQATTKSLMWVRETSGRPVDAVQLALLSDVYPPRILYISEEVRPSATLTLSVYLHATTKELDEIGDDYVLNEAAGSRGSEGTVGQQARLWSRNGVLLATTEQLCWYQ